MGSIKLYNYFRSSTSFRVRIALNLKGLPYDYIPVHLLKDGGEQNKPDYRTINPMGGVPTLVDGSVTVAQSSAIIEYLDETYSHTYQLLPKDTKSRAKIRQFCQIINADTHAYANLKTLQYLEKNFTADDHKKKQWIQHFVSQGLSACEKMISENKTTYSFSNSVTAADVFLVPQIFTALRFDVDLSPFPHLKRVYDECLKHPAFIKAHPFRQTDTPEEFKLK